MNLLNYLKEKREILLKYGKEDEKTSFLEEPNIEIIIENHNKIFKDEEEIIIKGAKDLLAKKAC